MATIYLVRHGQASFGQHDYDRLSPVGEQQSEVTGQWLKNLNRVFALTGSGTLLRQRQTLAGIFRGMEMPGKQPDMTLPGLDELDVDDLLLATHPDASSRAELDAHMMKQPDPAKAFFEMYRSALLRWADGKHDHCYKETWSAFKNRTLAAVHKAADELGDNESALLVSSGGVIATVLLQLLNIPETDILRINRQVHNASITTIHAHKGKLHLHGFNNYAHLEQLGERQLLTRI